MLFKKYSLLTGFFLSLSLFCSFAATAQLQVWRHINTSEMTNTNVTWIMEGPAGFMYFGTQEGVNIFDGRRFRLVEIPGRVSKGIDQFTYSMRWGRGNILWVTSRTHIYNYDATTGDVHVVYATPESSVLFTEIDTVRNRLYAFYADSMATFSIDGKALTRRFTIRIPVVIKPCITNDGDLLMVGGGNMLLRIKDTAIERIYSAPVIKDVAWLKDRKSLLMLTNDGLQLFDLASGNTTTLKPKKNWNLKSAKTRIAVLADEQVLVQNAENVYLLKNLFDSTFIDYAPDDRNPYSIRSNFITYAYSDRRKNLWIAEDGIGVSVLPANSHNIHYLPGTMIGAARLWRSYHDTAHKQVFQSSENGLCAIHYDADTVNFKPNIKPEGTKLFEVMAYIPWDKDLLLLITNGQGSWLFNTATYKFQSYEPLNKRFAHIGFWGAKVVSEGNYFIYGANGSYLFNRKDFSLIQIKNSKYNSAGAAYSEIDKSEIFTVCIDSKKQIWLGTGYGVEILDSNFHSLRKLGRSRVGRNDGLGNTVILDIMQALNGKIYAATMGGGVYEYNNDSGIFKHIDLAGNLSNIYCITSVDEKNLLITTSKGMCLYNTGNGLSWAISENNGMPITDFNQFALVNDDKFIIGAGAKGVVLIDKEGLFANFKDTAEIQVMQGAFPIRNLVLGKGNHTIDVDLTITGYSSNDPWHIQYRLAGVDDNWREMTKGEWHVHYNSIEPGSYRLDVKAVDEQHVSRVTPISIQITALPFFWQTAWFRLVMLAVAIGGLIGIVRFFSQLQLKWRLKKMEDEQKVSRERLRISRELHDNVGSQLTSLITGLESTGMMIKGQQPELLEKRIAHLHSSARQSMHQLRDSIWALNSESVSLSALTERFDTWIKNMLHSYPHIKVNIVNSITTDFVLDPLKSLNLFRIMQESVHNALKHANADIFDISYKTEGETIIIKVQDNGKGFETTGKGGNGLKFMTARAEEIAAAISVDSAPNIGTAVTVTIEMK